MQGVFVKLHTFLFIFSLFNKVTEIESPLHVAFLFFIYVYPAALQACSVLRTTPRCASAAILHAAAPCMLPCRWTALTGRLGCGSLVYIHDACFPKPVSNHWLLTRFVPVRCYGSWNIFNAVGNIKRFLTNFTKFWIRWATNKSQTIHILQRITFQWPKIKKKTIQ